MAAEGLPEWDTDVVTTRKSWAERKDQVEHELRMEALAERFKSGAHRPTRGSQHDLDPCHRRPVPVRPASAAPRPLGLPVTDTARTDALAARDALGAALAARVGRERIAAAGALREAARHPAVAGSEAAKAALRIAVEVDADAELAARRDVAAARLAHAPAPRSTRALVFCRTSV